MGSSRVMACTASSRFIFSSRAARVVDLPEPVAPVTRMKPFNSFATSWIDFGRLRSSIVGISVGCALTEYFSDYLVVENINNQLVILAR